MDIWTRVKLLTFEILGVNFDRNVYKASFFCFTTQSSSTYPGHRRGSPIALLHLTLMR